MYDQVSGAAVLSMTTIPADGYTYVTRDCTIKYDIVAKAGPVSGAAVLSMTTIPAHRYTYVTRGLCTIKCQVQLSSARQRFQLIGTRT